MAACAPRAAFDGSLQVFPGNPALQRDVILGAPLIADLLQMQQCRQALIDEPLLRAFRARSSMATNRKIECWP
jgi:hypothetical protein